MNTTQQILVVLFVAALVVTYWSNVVDAIKRLFGKCAEPAPEIAPEEEAQQPSVALRVVNDIVAVTQLRDKLASENCPEGVEACTNLLRVIVEHQVSSEGAA